MSEHAVEREQRGPVAWVWLNRPEVHNAFDAALIEELTAMVNAVAQDEATRVLVLAARGKSFCAGAQVQWMQAAAAATEQENVEDAQRLAAMFEALATCPKPTVARVQGAALGGGVGLLAACDVAVAAETAVFATSEVRLGLIPATIAPYVVRAVGERQAMRLFLTGERVDAQAAQAAGLVQMVVAPEQMEERVEAVVRMLLAGAPEAQREAKELVRAVAGRPVTPELIEDTAERIARRRGSAEAAEGLAAFLAKRPAAWVPSA